MSKVNQFFTFLLCLLGFLSSSFHFFRCIGHLRASASCIFDLYTIWNYLLLTHCVTWLHCFNNITLFQGKFVRCYMNVHIRKLVEFFNYLAALISYQQCMGVGLGRICSLYCNNFLSFPNIVEDSLPSFSISCSLKKVFLLLNTSGNHTCGFIQWRGTSSTASQKTTLPTTKA